MTKIVAFFDSPRYPRVIPLISGLSSKGRNWGHNPRLLTIDNSRFARAFTWLPGRRFFVNRILPERWPKKKVKKVE